MAKDPELQRTRIYEADCLIRNVTGGRLSLP
jgi:hypothetical protein